MLNDYHESEKQYIVQMPVNLFNYSVAYPLRLDSLSDLHQREYSPQQTLYKLGVLHNLIISATTPWVMS